MTIIGTDGDMELILRIHRGGGANSNNSNHPPPHHDTPRSHPANTNTNYSSSSSSSSHHPRRPQVQNSTEGCDPDIGHIALLSPHPNDNGSSSTLPRNTNNSVRVAPKHLKNFRYQIQKNNIMKSNIFQ